MGGGDGEEPAGARLRPPTCTERLDRAFQCASSSAQLRELYRFGELRNCRPLFGALYDCLLSRTRLGEPEEVWGGGAAVLVPPPARRGRSETPPSPPPAPPPLPSNLVPPSPQLPQSPDAGVHAHSGAWADAVHVGPKDEGRGSGGLGAGVRPTGPVTVGRGGGDRGWAHTRMNS